MKILELLVAAVGLAVLAARCCEVAQSPCGLWTASPHSGATPDCPREAPNTTRSTCYMNE